MMERSGSRNRLPDYASLHPVAEKYFVRVDVIEEFPFLVTK